MAEANWYVVHTYSGYENKVAQNIEKVVDNRKLHELIPEVRVPTEIVTEIKDNKTRDVERKVFPSYVLVRMILTDESWYVVRNIRGVTGFVGPGSKPIPLTDKEAEGLGVVKQATLEIDFKVGDSVVVSAGTLEGFVGIVKKIDIDERTVDVMVSMFGRETPATLDITQVSRLKN